VENREDSFDYATQCAFWVIRHLRNHLLTIEEDSPDAMTCYLLLTKMNEIIDIISPDVSWPKEDNIVPFIPRQRA
jgi:hypothetical protein